MKEERLYQVCQTQTVSGKGLAEALRRRREVEMHESAAAEVRRAAEEVGALRAELVAAGGRAIQQLASIHGNLAAESLGRAETDCVIRDVGAVLARAKEVKV
jgi:hypothetical protein